MSISFTTGRYGATALSTVVIVLAACTVAILRGSGVAEALLVDDVRADANWILSAQLSDGAIANYVDKQAVWPYLANFAASGLARAKEVTGDKRYTEAAWRWLSWYESKQNAQGFVTDYTMKNGAMTSTGDMDSTDSYAGTFLLATRDVYRATTDLARLKKLRTAIVKAVSAMEATQQADGLTWAKPAWHVKYLMDQAEVYAGFLAAADVAKTMGDAALAQRATAGAARVKSGVETLWNPTLAAYDWAVHENGVHVANDWTLLYSDSLQQPWAISFGVVEPVRAAALATKFNVSQPNWALPAASALFSGKTSQTVGYWPEAALAYAQLGSPVAPPAVTSIRSAAVSANRAWPFTTGNAGQLIMLEAYSPALSLLPKVSVSLAAQPAPTTTTTTAPVASPKTALAAPAVAVAAPAAPAVAASPAPAPAPPPPVATTTTTAAPKPVAAKAAQTAPNNPVDVNLDLGAVSARASLGQSGLGLSLGLGGKQAVGVGSTPGSAR